MLRRAWPSGLLVVALVATTLLRVPLIANARATLDSDLAVDGLTLREALGGHWRWHYPGTPHVGTASLLIMLPVGLAMGVNPGALAVSGAILWGLVVVATFLLALRVFGPRVAAWSLLPLAISSTGTIWLSGRITGGHLLAVAWHALAFLILYELITRGGWVRSAALGLWCGLGVWNDSMGLMTLVGVVAAGLVLLVAGRGECSATPAVGEGFPNGGRRRKWLGVLAIGLGFLLGLMPKLVGRRVDPYDAYNEQFSPIWRADVLREHAQILALDCLPRLVAGHRLPGLEAEPGGIGPEGKALPARSGGGLGSIATVALGLGLFLVAVPGLTVAARDSSEDRAARRAVRWGMLVASAAVLASFVINRNIFNSDNYRYLVLLLVPWAVGFGRLMDGLARNGRGGLLAAGLVGFAFALAFASDDAAWCRGLGWIDAEGGPVVRVVEDPILDRLLGEPEVTSIAGDYWDVYRYAFLSDGRFLGVPSPRYPNRFPEWTARLAGGHPTHVVARGGVIGAELMAKALGAGGAILSRGRDGTIASWPAARSGH